MFKAATRGHTTKWSPTPLPQFSLSVAAHAMPVTLREKLTFLESDADSDRFNPSFRFVFKHSFVISRARTPSLVLMRFRRAAVLVRHVQM